MITFTWIPRYPDEGDEEYVRRRAKMLAALAAWERPALSVTVTASADLSKR